MSEKPGIIRNPLTVISGFAALAEVSGTVVLPLIDKVNQFYFMCFLMFFPTFLVALFFLTLNRNHHVLYAPSDFRNEDNYFKNFEKTSVIDRAKKIEEEIRQLPSSEKASSTSAEQEIRDTLTEDSSPSLQNAPDVETKLQFRPNLRLKIEEIEDLVVRQLSLEESNPVLKGMTLRLDNGRKLLFDAVTINGNDTKVFEIKYTSKNSNVRVILLDTISKMRNYMNGIPDYVGRHFSVTIIMVTEDEIDVSVQQALKNKSAEYAANFGYPLDVRFFSASKLRNLTRSNA